MKPGETLHEFDERFSSIIVELTSLGKAFSNREIALKVMRALPREWDVKTVAMRESKDLNKLELHDLFADLKAYEFELGIRTEEEPSTSHPTKALAATVATPAVEEISIKKSAEIMSSEAMSLFVRKFGKFMRKNQSNLVNSHYKKDHTSDGQACFNCGKKAISLQNVTGPKRTAGNNLRSPGGSKTRRNPSRKRKIKRCSLLMKARANGRNQKANHLNLRKAQVKVMMKISNV